MPKPSAYALIWSDEHQSYDLHHHGQLHQSFHLHDESTWLAWVQEHTTVAFHGQAGYLSLIKEARPLGSSYWYAYRRQARRTSKCYVGPSARLTFAHLEQIATQLTRVPILCPGSRSQSLVVLGAAFPSALSQALCPSPTELAGRALALAQGTGCHLVVSPNTIKTQVSSIYRKLGVSRRAQTIAAARQLSWLSSVKASSPQHGHP